VATSKVFSAKFRGVVSFGMAQASNPQKFFPQKLYFSPIRESFLPRMFPAIMVQGDCFQLVQERQFTVTNFNAAVQDLTMV